jgi:hypothetical protein
MCVYPRVRVSVDVQPSFLNWTTLKREKTAESDKFRVRNAFATRFKLIKSSHTFSPPAVCRVGPVDTLANPMPAAPPRVDVACEQREQQC